MKHVKSHNIERVAFLDIETAAIAKDYYSLSEDGKKAWQYKMRQDGVLPTEEVLNDKFKQSASLYSEFNRIVAFGVGYFSEGKFRLKTESSDNEKELLLSLTTFLDNLAERKFKLCGHAMIYFDAPTIIKRCLGNGLPIPNSLDHGNLKPWETSTYILDTNVLYRGFTTGPGSSLIALCFHLNVPTPKVDIEGRQVSEYYYKGDLEIIEKYVGYDVLACFNVFRRMRGEDIVLYDDCLLNPGPVVADEIMPKVLLASKIKGKKQLYNVQLDNNEDIIVKSKSAIEKGMEVSLVFNEKMDYHELQN